MSITAASAILLTPEPFSQEPAAVVPGTILGRDLTSDHLVPLSFRSRTNGLYIIGKQGRGKTNFLLNLILQDLYHGLGLCVLDPHGDLIVDILGCVPEKREHDVFLLDLQDTKHPFAFDLFAGVNPHDAESLKTGEERIVGTFKKVWGDSSWGPRLEDLLGNAVHVLLMNPGTTLAQLPTLLTDENHRKTLLNRVSSDVVREYFVNEYGPLTPRAQGAIYGPLMNKVRKFLRDPLLGQIVSQPGATVDFRDVMARKQILLIRLNAQWEEATSLLGTAIVLQLFQAALDRKNLPAQKRAPFALYADEFHLFATPTFGQLFQQVRKYNVATTIAHQVRSQLSGDLQDAVKGAVNIVTFQTMTDDASEMAREYQSSRAPEIPPDLFAWADKHSDSSIKAAAARIKLACLAIEIRYEEEAPPLSYHAKLDFMQRRLRQAVREGDAKASPFPRHYWYGVYDLEVGSYGELAEAFGILRERLLATKRIDSHELSQLPTGEAAAKLERSNGSMRQCLLKFPLAVSSDHSLIVKTLFDREGPMPETWPDVLDPKSVQAGLRSRRIREHTRQRYAPSEEPEAPSANTSPPVLESSPPARKHPPARFEVDLD